MSIGPLNGTQTHPLSAHAMDALRSIERHARPPQEINAGVINRLMREALIEIVYRPSPYKTGRGRSISFAQITAAGLAEIARVKPVA